MSAITSLPQVPASRRTRLSRTVFDWAFSMLVILIGVFQLTHYQHFADFMGDVSYPDLARSLLEHGSYQIRLLPQTTLPPGLPIILACAGKFLGISPAVAFGVVAVFTILGIIAAYELLRRVEGRGVAVSACLLLMSCPPIFGFNTAVVFPEMPYLFMSMAAILLVLAIDRAQPGARVIHWIFLLAAVLPLAILIRSVGVALLAAFFTWIAASLLADRAAGRRRVIRFALPVALGIAAQLGWTLWAQHHQVLEWKLPGYPASYVQQLKVKNGQYPELGYAHLSDIPNRISRNVIARAAGFSQLFFGRGVSRFWSSPAIAGLIILIVTGLATSFRGGGQIYDWYFVWYEFIFMLWPWDYRDRFILPIIPLAWLYLWRGAKAIAHFLMHRPRKAGLALLLVGFSLCLCSAAFVLHLATFPPTPGHVRGDHLQPLAATAFWAAVALLGAVVLLWHQLNPTVFADAAHWAQRVLPLYFRIGAATAIILLTTSNLRALLRAGHYNLHPIPSEQGLYPEFQASAWIRSHEPSGVVVMAREPEFVFHYTQDPAVWFPPISDPAVLMAGIRRLHVSVIEVAHHSDTYWLPSEEACFLALQHAYPSSIHVIHRGSNYSVYEVEPSALQP